MKKNLLTMLFVALFVTACGPSPSSDMYSLEFDFKEFKKSEQYKEFWEVLGILKEFKDALSDEHFIKKHEDDIDSLLTVMGISASECNSKLLEIVLKAKNKKVINHFHFRSELYQNAGLFWAEDWSEYRGEKTTLPDIVQMVDETFKQKDYLDNEYMRLRNET